MRYNGFLLPYCPMTGYLGRKGGNQSATGKVRLTGMGLVRAVCNDENYFLIDGSKAGSVGSPPAVTLTGMVDNEPQPVHLRAVAKDVYEASYNPREGGAYLLNVTWAGRLVKGCPLKIEAEDRGGNGNGGGDNSAASKVFCSGEGLRLGTLGKDIRSFIDTRKAGPGELHCVGPRGKTAYCELNDHQDGTFTLNLKPQVRYLKYSFNEYPLINSSYDFSGGRPPPAIRQVRRPARQGLPVHGARVRRARP